MNKIIRNALIDSLGAIIYIFLIAFFLSSAQSLFGDTKTVLIPVAMLTLLVLSAAITGSLVFGRSVLWYMEGDKREAVKLVGYKLIVLFIMAVIVFTALYLVR